VIDKTNIVIQLQSNYHGVSFSLIFKVASIYDLQEFKEQNWKTMFCEYEMCILNENLPISNLKKGQ